MTEATAAPAAPAGESPAATAAPGATPAALPSAAPGATLIGQADGGDAAAQAAKPAADAAAAEAEAKPADKPAERAAPEAYEFKAPEGVTLDAGVLAEFEAAARELKMPQAEAQAMVERMAPKIAAQVQAQQTKAVEQASQQWFEAVQADAELGGQQLQTNMGAAARALKAYATPELRQLLETSRLGNHPEVVRFIVRAGKAIGEDGFVGGKPTSAASKSLADRLYPSTH